MDRKPEDSPDAIMRKVMRAFAIILLVVASALLSFYIIPFWIVSMGEPYNKMFNGFYKAVDAMRLLGAIFIFVSYVVLGSIILIIEKKTRRKK